MKKVNAKTIILCIIKYLVIALILYGLFFVGLHWRKIAGRALVEVARYEAANNMKSDAISYYRYALKIDKENTEAYMECAEIYREFNYGDFSNLLLKEGYNLTHSEDIKNLLADGQENTADNTMEKKSVHKVIKKDENGKILEKSEYIYNDNNEIEIVNISDEDNNFIGREEYIYDEEGEFSGVENYSYNYTKNYTYDSSGKVIKVEETSLNNATTQDKEFRITDEGEIVTGEDYNYSIQYEYDENGILQKAQAISNHGVYDVLYKYDDNMQLTGVDISKDEEEIRNLERIYTKEGKLSEVILTEGENRKRKVFNYDENGNLTNRITTFEYYSTEGKTWEPALDLWGGLQNTKVYSEENLIYVYNDENKVIGEVAYFDGVLGVSFKYDYNQNGIISEENCYNGFSVESSYIETYIYQDDKMKQANIEYVDGTSENEVYEYNEKGECISHLIRKADNSSGKDLYLTYIFDENGKVTEESVYTIEINRKQYDRKNYTIDGYTAWYKETDALNQTVVDAYEEYKYDKGLVAETFFDPETGLVESRNTYTYNDKGQVEQKIGYDNKNAVYLIIDYVYDEDGNVSEESIEKNRVKNKYSYEYEYR